MSHCFTSERDGNEKKQFYLHKKDAVISQGLILLLKQVLKYSGKILQGDIVVL